jgi:hypothetical protein
MSAAGAATFNSTVAATGFIIGSANIGEAELEILDGLAATTAELTVIDGDTSATGTTVADADRVVMNDNGTMVQVAVTDLAAYFDDEITAMPNLITTAATTVGALDSGSITSGFGTIDTGSSNITTTGVGAFGSLDISGDIDVDGTTNLDIVDIDGAVNMATTALVTGVLTTTAATVFNGGFASNSASTITVDDNVAALTLTSTDADANEGPILKLHRNSASPADSDAVGRIDFNMENDAGEDTNIIAIAGTIEDASDGSESGNLNISLRMAGSARSRMSMFDSTTVFNEDSQDIDFRVESNGNANMLFVDGGNNRVGVGTNIPSVEFEIADSNSDCEMTIGSWADNINTKSALNFVKSRNTTIGTGAATSAADNLGEILAYGYDTGNTARAASQILFQGDAAPDGDAVPGRILFKTSNAAALQTALTIDDSQGAVFAGTLATAAKGITAASLPAGSVIQVVSAIDTTETSSTSSTMADTGLTVNITPSASSSKVLVNVGMNFGVTGTGAGLGARLMRGSTAIQGISEKSDGHGAGETSYHEAWVAFSYLDSPNTTSETTYKVQFRTPSGGTIFASIDGNVSSITVMEIAA